jgi:hypothetical protein
LYVVIPRTYATATGVKYNITHQTSTLPNPREVKIDQKNNDENKMKKKKEIVQK